MTTDASEADGSVSQPVEPAVEPVIEPLIDSQQAASPSPLLRAAVLVCGAIALLVGVVALTGRLAGVPALGPLPYSFALGILFCGIGVFGTALVRPGFAGKAALAGGLLGTVALTEAATGVELGVGLGLLEPAAMGSPTPGPAMSLVALSVPLVMLNRAAPTIRNLAASALLSAVVGTYAMVAAVGYLTGPGIAAVAAATLLLSGGYLSTWAGCFETRLRTTTAALDELQRRTEEGAVNEREGRQRLRFLLDALAEAIYTVDADGRCTFCNTACLDLLGFDRMEQVVGRSMHELMHQGRADATAEAACPICRSHRCDERVHVDDATLWRADGSSFAAECWAHPLTWHGPTVIAAVVTFLDVTRRREAEEESLRLNLELEARVCDRTAQLESANRELEAFSYSVSHDLRAPLRAIDGFAEILAADHSQQLGDEGLRVLGVIRRNVGKMGHLIDGLLQFSRLGRKDIHAELVDMGALASSVLEELVTQETERHIETRVGDLPPVAGDPVLLHQVWMNLLGNAVKYSGRRRDAVVQVDASESGGEVVYTVRDNGVGFDMTYVDKVFGVFQRLHKESEFPGTGLGLALVQRIVARHHGRVWAESVVDEGAAFHFALPGIRSEVD